MKQKNQERLIALGLFTLLVILLIPLLLIARYNVMSLDDYSYANMAKEGLYEGQSFLGILLAQVQNSVEYWKTWQGPYFSTFLQFTFWALEGEKYYFLTTAFTLLPLLFADFFLGYVLLKKGFGAPLSQVLIATIPIMIYHMSFPASLVEAYYWFCGAVLYTTFYALSIFALSLMIDLLYIQDKGKTKEKVYKIILIILSFCLGGGNFVTGIFMVLVYLMFAVYGIWSKHKQRIFYCVNFAVLTGCFMLSVFSPGSTNRMAVNSEAQVGVIKAILLSLYEAAKYIKTWTFPFIILLLIALIPLFWKIIKNKNYKFPLPGLVLLISFGFYAAQFTPNQYALGILGAYRVQNIYRFQILFWLLGNEFYILGYVHRRFPDFKIPFAEKVTKLPLASLVYGFIATCIVFFNMYYYVGQTLSSASAYFSLRNGSAENYYQEYLERLDVLEDETVKDAVLESYSSPPYALFFGDISSKDSWENAAMAEYFGKDTVIKRSDIYE